MMGVISNLLLDFIDQVKGSGARDVIVDRLGGQEFKDGHIYPEKDFQKLFDVACEVYGAEGEKLEEEFAKYSGKMVCGKFSRYFEGSRTSRDLFRKVPSIHKQYPFIAAYGKSDHIFPTAKISILKDQDNELIYAYKSSNKLCTFLKVMAKWVSESYYREKIDIQETQCTKAGDEFCRIVMKWKCE